MTSSQAACCLHGVCEEAKTRLSFFFRSASNETIIRLGFCDIQNNQGRGRGLSAEDEGSRLITITSSSPIELICTVNHFSFTYFRYYENTVITTQVQIPM